MPKMPNATEYTIVFLEGEGPSGKKEASVEITADNRLRVYALDDVPAHVLRAIRVIDSEFEPVADELDEGESAPE